MIAFRSGIAAAVLAALCITIAGGSAAADGKAPPKPGGKDVERGRYLVKIAGCNDCHTPGYMMTNGKVPEPQWLTGDTLGWRGAWGTTYAINLRLYMQSISEEEWLKIAATKETRPPMPWYVLRDLTKDDLRAIYRYVRHAGPAGKPAPAYLPPDKEPPPPFATFPAPPK
jgi:mono/diheme cytochrome c family protein